MRYLSIICTWTLLSACGGKKKAPTFLPKVFWTGMWKLLT